MDLLTTQQASQILGVTEVRIRALIHAGRLPARKVGRDWLIDPRDVASFERKPQGNYKLNEDQIGEIQHLVRAGHSIREIASQYNVSTRTVQRHIANQ